MGPRVINTPLSIPRGLVLSFSNWNAEGAIVECFICIGSGNLKCNPDAFDSIRSSFIIVVSEIQVDGVVSFTTNHQSLYGMVGPCTSLGQRRNAFSEKEE